MGTGQPVFVPMHGGQPLTRMVTINDTMPFCVLFRRDAEVNLMIL
jgi:hypothetical protein